MRALVLAGLVAACSYYDRPSYETALFTCDASHGCPSGETCLGGLCQYVGANRNGVACGSATAPTSCTPDQLCCYDLNTPPSYCELASMACSDGTLCDEQADCADGTVCCQQGSIAMCTPGPCTGTQLCPRPSSMMDLVNCPGDKRFCCPSFDYPNTPWGECSSSC
jgi:hypothetical protein